jgi:acetyl esterase/lipase
MAKKCSVFAALVCLDVAVANWDDAEIWETDQITITTDIQCGAASLYSQAASVTVEEDYPLFLDVHFPPCAQEPCELRPGMVLLHGGSFTDGYKEYEGYPELATLFAMRGFVVLNADYRQMLGEDSAQCSFSLEDEVPQLSAAEDARAALRYLNSQADVWGVDTSKIVIAGGKLRRGHIELRELRGDRGGGRRQRQRRFCAQ